MTDPKRIHDALEQIAGEAVPEDTDLWQQIRAKAASMQHTQPLRISRPAFRPSLPSLRLAGAALALLLCVVIGFSMVSSLLNPGVPPVIALLTTPFNTLSPSPQADPTALAMAVNATVTSLLPEKTQTQIALMPENTPAPQQPTFPTNTEPVTQATPALPVVEVTESSPSAQATPTTQATQANPAIMSVRQGALGEQTLNGVTVTLDWAYLDESSLTFQYSVRGLPEEEGLDLRGAARVTGVTSRSTTMDLTGSEPGEEHVLREEGALVILETREVQHAVRPGEQVPFSIDITAGGITLPRSIRSINGSQTAVEGMELPLAGVFHFDINVPFQPALRLEPEQVTEVNGVRMELNWMRISHARTELGVCFNVPASGDWQLEGSTSLKLGSSVPVTLSEQGFDLSQSGSDPTAEPLRRCLHTSFDVQYDGAPTTASLTIPSLSTPADFVNRFEEARKILSAQGIEIEKVAVESGFEIRITRRPDSMSEEEANRRMFEAARQVRVGPWVFTIPVPGR